MKKKWAKNKEKLFKLMAFTGFLTWLGGFLFLCLILVLVFCHNTSSPNLKQEHLLPTPTPLPTPVVVLSHDVLLKEVNNYRISRGLEPLFPSEKACQIADIRIKEVVENFSHDGFKAERFCNNCELGEVLARGYSNEAETVNGWLNSAVHKYILEKNYQYFCARTKLDYAVVIGLRWL